MIANIIVLVAVAVVGWHLYETIAAFRAAEGTTKERWCSAFRSSLTIFWTRVSAFATVAIAVVAEGANYAGLPGVKETIEPYMTPQLMLLYTLVVILGAEASRRRSL